MLDDAAGRQPAPLRTVGDDFERNSVACNGEAEEINIERAQRVAFRLSATIMPTD